MFLCLPAYVCVCLCLSPRVCLCVWLYLFTFWPSLTSYQHTHACKHSHNSKIHTSLMHGMLCHHSNHRGSGEDVETVGMGGGIHREVNDVIVFILRIFNPLFCVLAGADNSCDAKYDRDCWARVTGFGEVSGDVTCWRLMGLTPAVTGAKVIYFIVIFHVEFINRKLIKISYFQLVYFYLLLFFL